MTKTIKDFQSTDVNETTAEVPQMMTNVVTKVQTTVALPKIVLENPNGTSHRLVVYNHEGWNPTLDLSLTDLVQARAGLNGIAKNIAGGLHGSAKLLIVAPTEKLAFANGTGTFAYVRNDFVPGVDDITVDLGNTRVFLTVDPADIPVEKGYRRLHLDGGSLYAKSWEPVFTARDDDPWTYWYCRAMSATLEGHNVSISIGPKMLDDAKAVMAVVQSDDPAVANEARLYAGRVSSRFGSAVKAQASEMAAVANETGVAPVVAASDLDVPLQSGGFISLKRYTPLVPIYLANASGMQLRARFLTADNDIARLAMAQAIRDNGFVVVLK